MKKRLIIGAGAIAVIVTIFVAILNFNLTKYEYSSYNYYNGNISIQISDYKLFRILKSTTKDKDNNKENYKIILTKNEFDNIMQTAKLIEENNEGIRYLKEDEFVNYLYILSHGDNIYTINNNVTNETENYVSRDYANRYFKTAYKVFEFNIPKEYTIYYFEHISSPGGANFENVQDIVDSLKIDTNLKYKDATTKKTYSNYIDIFANSDESITIKYYGVASNLFGTFSSTNTKYDANTGITEKYVLNYNKETDEWSYQELD